MTPVGETNPVGGATTAGEAGEALRVAVVGLGWAGRSIWLPRLREHPAFTVVAAVDPEPAARAAAADIVPGMALFADVDEIGRLAAGAPAADREPGRTTRAGGVDLAIVAVPNHRHADIAARLLTAGVPVFLEKPVCLSSAEADRLAAAEVAGNATLLAGSAARYRADVSRLYDLVAALGEIRHVDLAWVRARGVPDAGGWFTRRDLAGGGALVDLGWHLLDTLTPMLGAVAFRAVVGTTSDDFVRNMSWAASWRHDGSGGAGPGGAGPGGVDVGGGESGGGGSDATGAGNRGDVEDTARGFLVTENGISVSLRASWASHEARDVTSIAVEGTTGTASLRCTFGFGPNRQDRSALTCTRAGETLAVPLPDEPIGTEYRRQLDELPGLLADPGSRGRAIDEVRPTIAAIERFYDSAHGHRPVASLASAAR